MIRFLVLIVTLALCLGFAADASARQTFAQRRAVRQLNRQSFRVPHRNAAIERLLLEQALRDAQLRAAIRAQQLRLQLNGGFIH